MSAVARRHDLDGLPPGWRAWQKPRKEALWRALWQERYANSLAAFARDCIDWPEGEGPTPYQNEVWEALPEMRSVALRSPHGAGKSACAAITIIAFALTRDGRVDWKVPTTASVWRQLSEFLWPEVHLWARRIRWDRVPIPAWREGDALLDQAIRGATGSAFAIASSKPEMMEGAHAAEGCYIYDEAKPQSVDTPIPTPTGWTTIGALSVGDEVLDEQGRPCAVTWVSPVYLGRPCSRVTFEDGAEIIADDGHLWAALPEHRRQTWGMRHTNDSRYKRTYAQVKDWRDYWDRAEVLTTVQLKPLPHGSGIPTCRPLDLPEADLPIDPYVLGVWLGDGTSGDGSVCSADPEIPDRIRAAGYRVERRPSTANRTAPMYGVYGLARQLRLNGLRGNKHIPTAYLRASHQQRLELLRGLMDTDGSVMGTGTRGVRDSRVSITQVRENLADDIAELVRTFGCKVRVRKTVARLKGIDMGPAFMLRWSADECPFTLERKARRWAPRAAQASASTIRTIRSVTPVATRPVRCITVDSPRHLFLAGEGFIPTHNSIQKATWEATAGAISTGTWWRLALSTPGEPSGEFYEINAGRRQGWHVRPVTLEESVDAGRVKADWAQRMAEDWGTNSIAYRTRVLGEFAADEAENVIPLAWLEAANERWLFRMRELGLEVDREGRIDNVPPAAWWQETLGPLTTIGVDVGDTGPDASVLALRHGNLVTELREVTKGAGGESGDAVMATAGMCVRVQRARGGILIVDAGGLGAGAAGAIREQGVPVIAHQGGMLGKGHDRSGELQFENARAQAWWILREALHPTQGDELAIPPIPRLTGDLTSVRWSETSRGRILLEPKPQLISRLGRSPDYGDAVVLAFWRSGEEKLQVLSPAAIRLPGPFTSRRG